MKIYLISPKNPTSFWTFDHVLPTLGKRCVYPNLALPTLAALTPPEHEVVLCDENVTPIDYDTDADIVGITGYVIHRARVFEIAAAFRERGVLVVAGGPFATLCPEELRDRVDVLFRDEAEYTWPQFLTDYPHGCHLREYRQIEKPSMTDSPLPRFELLDVAAYQTMTVQFGRGCPYNCEFCDIIVMYGRRPRNKSVDQVMAEIRAVHRLGSETIFIVDDNFIGDKKRAKELLRAIVAWQRETGYAVEFLTEVTLNVAQDAELLELLRAANFASVFIGIESPRAASLLETHKTQNLREDMQSSVQRIQRAGIEVMAGMIVGFDHDDASIFAEHFAFIQDCGIPVSMTGMLNALPQTPLYERLRRAGRLQEESGGDQFVVTNIVPSGMTVAELYSGYRALLEQLYDYGNFYSRAMRLIRNLGSRPNDARSLRRSDLHTLGRFFVHCILRGGRRRAVMTLRLLVATATYRLGALRTAVALALMHKHLHDYVDTIAGELRSLEETPEPAAAVPRPAPSTVHAIA